jgi:FkbM family methyltransferase
VIIVDPTPASIAHYQAVMNRIGQKSTTPYNKSGRLPATSYDLSSVSLNNFSYCPKALWTENTKLKFYLPPSECDVSYSVSNFLNNYTKNNQFIEVDAISIDSILKEYKFDVAPLLVKLDIEGAEIQVLPDMLKKGIKPSQILVEFDELSIPCARSRDGVQQCHDALLEAGYKLIHREKWNFLYINFVN